MQTQTTTQPWPVQDREPDDRPRDRGTVPVAGTVGTEILGWGKNGDFQLGNGTKAHRNTPGPALLPDGTTVAKIAAGQHHGFALTGTGLVLGWGWNGYGQLGDGTNVSRDRPMQVELALPQGVDVAKVAAGSNTGAVVTSDGDLYTWGRNHVGQLGIGNTTNQPTPQLVTIPWTDLELPENSTVTAVDGGDAFMLALTSTGQVLAWGWGGALGNGQNANKTTAQRVSLPVGVTAVAVSAGYNFGLALTSTGRVLAWGANNFGQLANPDVVGSALVPVYVQGLDDVTITAIGAGQDFSIALTADGQVYAWGRNQWAQLGDGGTTDRPNVPGLVGIPEGVVVSEIAAGSFQSVAITSTRQALAWGADDYGQCGAGPGDGTKRRTTPVWVKTPPGTRVFAVASGRDHSLAIAAAGPQLGWGFNAVGQLGTGNTKSSSNPVDMDLPEFTEFRDLKAGFPHGLALTDGGQVLAWGSNSKGQLGTGKPGNQPVPQPVTLPEEAIPVAVAAGGAHSLALTTAGEIYAWGLNNAGQLGLGDYDDRPKPVRMPLADWLPPGTRIVAIATYNLHSLILLSTGEVWACGDNSKGQLGLGDRQNRPTPNQVILPTDVTATAIAAGGIHSLAITSTGDALAWGWNRYGQLGDGTNTDHLTPWPVSLNGAKATAITAGMQHSLAITTDGGVLGWGYNTDGELGDGTTTNQPTPVPMHLSEFGRILGIKVVSIAGGVAHSAVVTDTGLILACGGNSHGQLGDGTTAGQLKPVQVNQPIGTAAAAVTASQYHTLAR